VASENSCVCEGERGAVCKVPLVIQIKSEFITVLNVCPFTVVSSVFNTSQWCGNAGGF